MTQRIKMETVASTTIDETTSSLDLRILELIQATQDRTIRPAKVSTELGISINEATAELCGLLAAVGGGIDGAAFRFEQADGNPVMVFTFPEDFRARALRKRRRQDFHETMQTVLDIVGKILKTVTAFGLILSLLIVSLAAMMGLVAAVIGLSRTGNQGHRNIVVRQLRSMFYTTRQLLWCYAVFGPAGDDGQDLFLREVAYDTSLACSVCYGNPASFFYWIRAQQLARRSRVRGWTAFARSQGTLTNNEGAALLRPRLRPNNLPTDTPEISQRTLLPVAVEFLFGPPSYLNEETEKWKLRAHALIQKSMISSSRGVSLEEMSPYVDHPPATLSESSKIVEQGLILVAYFNGVPMKNCTDQPAKARFNFPELLSESSSITKFDSSPVYDDDGSWSSVLYAKEAGSGRLRSSFDVAESIEEPPLRFTQLPKKDFVRCIGLGLLNLIGVLWLGQSIGVGGALELKSGILLERFLRRWVVPILQFYGFLFLGLPAGRLGIVILRNKHRYVRNRKRRSLVKELTA
jgi:hypothetical protein